MSTSNLEVPVAIWVQIASQSVTDFLVTWETAKSIEFATTDTDTPPTVAGHRIPREIKVTREYIGAGYVWAKISKDTGVPYITVTVSKTSSTAGATGGYDSVEGVHKVAMMVWNPLLLQWERSTGASASEGGSVTTVTTKRYDIVSATVIYIGEAAVGTAENAVGWALRKITFTIDGNPLADMRSTGAWSNRTNLTYQ